MNWETFGRTIPLRLTWQPLSMLQWQLYAAQTMKSQWAQGGALGSMLYGDTSAEGLDDEQDSLKEVLLLSTDFLLRNADNAIYELLLVP